MCSGTLGVPWVSLEASLDFKDRISQPVLEGVGEVGLYTVPSLNIRTELPKVCVFWLRVVIRRFLVYVIHQVQEVRASSSLTGVSPRRS